MLPVPGLVGWLSSNDDIYLSTFVLNIRHVFTYTSAKP